MTKPTEGINDIIEREWLPIETAPKDECIIVCFDEPFFGKIIKEMHIGFFDSEENKFMFHTPFTPLLNKEILRPTHWMPLPTPPKEQNDE